MIAAEEIQTTVGYRRRWWGLLFIGISLVVISLDNTILNVALPSIAGTLEASLGELQWMVEAYILVFAALLLTMGGLGDRFGRKRALQVGLVIFGIGSVAAALSTTAAALIASRAFLGIGGAIIMPATLSIISATFPPHERARAIALWAAIAGLGIAVGPVIGGWLLERYDWNSVFFINLPVIAIALAGGAATLMESRDEHPPKADLPGVLLSIVGLFALVYGIIEAGRVGWTDQNVLIALAVGLVVLTVFAWWESRTPNAMLPTRFFRNMSFTGASLAIALVMFGLFGSIFFLSQYFQTVQGASPLESGLRILPLALTLAVSAAQSARIAARLGTKYTVALGIFIAGCGLLLMAATYQTDTPYSTIVIGQIILGIGMGLVVSPATNSIMQSVPMSKAGIGSAMNDTTRQLGGALGVAVLGAVMNSTYLNGIESLRDNLPIPAAFAAQSEQVFAIISSGIQGAHRAVERMSESPLVSADAIQTIIQTADRAFVDGMHNAMFIGAIIMAVAALFALLVLPNEVRSIEEEAIPGETSSIGAPSAGD